PRERASRARVEHDDRRGNAATGGGRRPRLPLEGEPGASDVEAPARQRECLDHRWGRAYARQRLLARLPGQDTTGRRIDSCKAVTCHSGERPEVSPDVDDPFGRGNGRDPVVGVSNRDAVAPDTPP